MKKAVCLLIVQDNLILAISRRNDPTKWGFPGGKVDPFETNSEACQREVKEELGLLAPLTAFEPLYVGFCPGRMAPPVDYWVTTYLWDFRIDIDKLKPEEGFQLRWMSFEELADHSVSPFADYNARVFDSYGDYVLSSVSLELPAQPGLSDEEKQEFLDAFYSSNFEGTT